ncbi:MAG: HIT domain-containing protein [Candidatus Dormibacteria bacterium]
MRQIWAPWRVDFIKGPKSLRCFLCDAAEAAPERDAELHILARTELCLVMMNKYPYNNGHLMVAPRAHLANLTDLPQASTIELALLTQRALRVLTATLAPDGFNLGVNQGKVAGAGVADHVHQHVVPRWDGDTNFMPVVSGVKVMNEHLDASYRAIREGFDRVT